MGKIKLLLKKLSSLRNLFSRRSGWRGKRLSWQARKNNAGIKASLINPELISLGCRNVLDIGCNAGDVARRVRNGRFVVGLDGNLDTEGYERPFEGVALGQCEVSVEFLENIPSFDAVLLLSVHHQWYASKRREDADRLFDAVMKKAKVALFVEFAAINEKYGGDQGFLDNDSESIIDYAKGFLERFVVSEKIRYLGKCPELLGKEPYRYMFLVDRAR